MTEFRDTSHVSPVISLSADLLYDDETCRPILQVKQMRNGNSGNVLSYTVSPNAAVPARVLEDYLAQFVNTFTHLVRFTFGIQEELELRSSTEGPQPPHG